NETMRFKQVTAFDSDAPVYPGGHPFVMRDGKDEFVFFSRPFPLTRVRATADSLARLGEYEALTCLVPGSRLKHPQFHRGPYGWKKNTPVVGPQDQHDLIKGKHLNPEEALLQLRDRETGNDVSAHHGSVYWNEFRQRWIMIAVEHFGTSLLGEIWYAEADSPL